MRNGGRSPPTSAPGRPSATTSANGRGGLEQLSALLVGETRWRLGRRPEPSLGVIDSRSVRMSHRVDANRGIDGNKKVEGRKRHVVTDSLGLVIGAAVHPANVHDGKGAMLVLDGLRGASRRLNRIIADGGRGGSLADWVMVRLGARSPRGPSCRAGTSCLRGGGGSWSALSPGWRTSGG